MEEAQLKNIFHVLIKLFLSLPSPINKSIMNKILFLLIGSSLFCGMIATKVQAQLTVSQASANIVEFKAAQVKYVNSFSQVNSNSSTSIIVPSENGKLVNSSFQNLACFSISVENKNSFSVSLPSHPVILKNLKNEDTIQVDGWQFTTQPGKGEFQKNIWVVNLGASLKIGSVNDKATSGIYSGTYLVTFIYN